MDVATGAMGSLIPKLVQLLQDEYKLQKAVREDVKFLEREMRSMNAALRKVARVPRDQLDEQVKIWADEVRELSYEMEDLVDGFLVRVEGSKRIADPDTLKGLMKKMTNLFKKGKDRHEIAHAIKDIKDQMQEVAARRDRYKVDDAGANSAATTTIDPRMLALFKDKRELVGIEEPRDELIKRLEVGGDGVSNYEQQLKILSIFGFGGLGKTTLAKTVYDRIQDKLVRKAFVSVGQNPNPKKILMDILRQLDKGSYSNATNLDEVRLIIEELRGLLEKKRYLIVIDDIWDESSWEIIKCAWIDSKCGSRIITTTRIFEFAKLADDVYEQEPLSSDRSKELFNIRLSIGKCQNSPDQLVEMSENILQKCGGMPLAITTIASLLVNKPREDWAQVYHSVGFGNGDNKQVDNTRKILLYSYYDLPCYLKNCLLHLGIYPEDYEIQNDTLIWKWVAEGFVHEKPGMRLFELGQRYFNELINRSMIQPVEIPHQGVVTACRVHDLVLDMIHLLAKEEKFVVLLGSNEQHTFSNSTARRLAIQKRVADEQQDLNLANTNMRQVRSFNATEYNLGIMPSLLSFHVLRVLALEGCTFIEDYSCHLEHLGKLLQLRYLGLSETPITELPGEIGELKFLQTLYLQNTKIRELPRSVGLLRQLKCLHLPVSCRGVLDRIGNLTSLEELRVFNVSPELVKELGKLTELRVFNVVVILQVYNAVLKDLIVSTGHLQKLQVLDIRYVSRPDVVRANCEDYVPSRHLRYLKLHHIELPRLPAWMDSSHLPHLSHLSLKVKVVEAQDVEILGQFLELITLTLRRGDVVFADVVGGGAFPNLRYLYTDLKLRFLQGAMPGLEFFEYFVSWEEGNTEYDFASWGNLPCLQKVKALIEWRIRGAVKEKVEAALRHTIQIHTNGPTLEFCAMVVAG